MSDIRDKGSRRKSTEVHDHYAEEQTCLKRRRDAWVEFLDSKDEEYPDSHEVLSMMHWMSYQEVDNPFNRSFEEPIDMEMVKQCLIQMRVTSQPLPSWVTDAILREIALLESDRDGELFLRKVNPRGGGKTTHPDDVHVQELVAEYALLAEKWGLDNDPKETIMSEFGIKRSTYYAWRRKYKKPNWIDFIASDRSEARHELLRRFNLLMHHFRPDDPKIPL